MIEIPDYVQKVLSVLYDNGFEGYLVGGCVRDALLCQEPHDYDLCTNALVEESKSIFKGFTVIPTGEKHGTLTILSDSHPIELTTYRIDGEYNDNRHPTGVSFTRNLHDDLSRRDFTINAFAYNKNGLVDDFNGLYDLKNKIIRCVGSPDKRFSEDALRILRALRFASVLDFKIDPDTATSIHKNARLLKNISVERIWVEFKRLLCGNGVEGILTDYSDVFSVFIPEIADCVGFEHMSKYHIYDVYTHIVKTVSLCPNDEITRISALFHDIAKPHCYTQEGNVRHFKGHAKASATLTENVLKRLKVDNDTINQVVSIVAFHDNNLRHCSKRTVLRTLSKIGIPSFEKLIDLSVADIKAHAPEYSETEEYEKNIRTYLQEIIQDKNAFKIQDLDINGYDIMEFGFKGKDIGRVQSCLLNAVIDEKTENNRSALKKYIKREILHNCNN